MQTPHGADFDAVARQYKAIHSENVRVFGESSDFFLRVKVELLQTQLDRLLPGRPALRVLDVGCGIGRFEEQAARVCPEWRILGLDLSRESLRAASEEASTAQHCYCAYDGLSMPVLPGSVDLAVLVCVLHHVLPPARAALITETVRTLRPGGLLAVFEHNPFNPLTRRIVERCEFDRDAQLLSLGQTDRLLRGAGLRLRRWGYFLFFPQKLRALRFLEPGLLRYVPLGGQHYSIFEKYPPSATSSAESLAATSAPGSSTTPKCEKRSCKS